jgi:20S proteasome alpha/beta subunit
MTIGLGALCAGADGTDASAVVVASDRMVTMGGITEFEHEVPKVTQIGDRIVALAAGDALRGAQLINELRRDVHHGAQQLQNVAATAAALYAALRRQQIESEILSPRGITMQQFYQGLQQAMLPQLVINIDNLIGTFNYNLEVLIAGADDSGAHLYAITNPGGSYDDFQPIGYAAIGSGALHAVQSLIGMRQAPLRSLHETVFNVYASKRRAEAAPGVGRETDVVIIQANAITRVEQPVLQQLDTLYQEYQRPVEEMGRHLHVLNLLSAPGQEEEERGSTAAS